MKIEKSIKYISSDCNSVVFIPGAIFPLSACLFVFGEVGLAALPAFVKKSKKVLGEIDLSAWVQFLDTSKYAELIKDGYSFCTSVPDNWESHCIFINDRSDGESTLLHEIIHLADFVIDRSNVSNDTEVRAYLFNYYEQTFKQIRK